MGAAGGRVSNPEIWGHLADSAPYGCQCMHVCCAPPHPTSKYSEYFRSAVTNVTVWHHRLKYPNPPDCHPRQYPTSLRFLTIQYCKELPGIVENGKFTAGILLLPPFPNIPMSWGGRRKRRALVSSNISTQGPPLVSALHRCSGV